MITQWGGALDSSAILPEYPRPQFQRKQFEILNGTWEYAVTSVSAQIPPDRFDGSILVPFSPESELSGVGRTLKPNECLWYRRTLEAPDGFDANTEDLILHFGAVDQFAEVRLNGVTISHHAGGYLPFSIVLSEAFVNGIPNELLVRVRDESDTSCWSRGKQSSKPGGTGCRGREFLVDPSCATCTLCLNAPSRRCGSSVVEHTLGKGEVESSILSHSTIHPQMHPDHAPQGCYVTRRCCG